MSTFKKLQKKSVDKIYLQEISSIRGNTMFIYDNYIFRTKNRERTYFVCKTEKCRAFMHVSFDVDQQKYYTFDIPDHDFNHTNHEKEIINRKHKIGLKMEAKKDINKNKNPKEIALTFRENNPSHRRLTLDAKFISIHKEPLQHISKLYEIKLNEKICSVLLYSNKSHTEMIFADFKFLELALQAKTIACDGTFSRCPITHYQLITFHIVTESHFSIPFLFILLNSKAAAIYSEIISKIDYIIYSKYNKLLFNRNDLSIKIDYEGGLIKCFTELKFEFCRSFLQF